MVFQSKYKVTLEVYCILYYGQTSCNVAMPKYEVRQSVKFGCLGRSSALADPTHLEFKLGLGLARSEITGAVTVTLLLLDLHCTGGSDAAWCTVSLSPPPLMQRSQHHSILR